MKHEGFTPRRGRGSEEILALDFDRLKTENAALLAERDRLRAALEKAERVVAAYIEGSSTQSDALLAEIRAALAPSAAATADESKTRPVNTGCEKG